MFLLPGNLMLWHNIKYVYVKLVAVDIQNYLIMKKILRHRQTVLIKKSNFLSYF